MRALRLGLETDNLLILNETRLAQIRHIHQINPDAIIVDSIQIVYKADLLGHVVAGGHGPVLCIAHFLCSHTQYTSTCPPTR